MALLIIIFIPQLTLNHRESYNSTHVISVNLASQWGQECGQWVTDVCETNDQVGLTISPDGLSQAVSHCWTPGLFHAPPQG